MNGSAGPVPPGLRLRIARPAVPPGYIHLTRVNDAFRGGERGQVALVVAGPGYGKTLAAAAWSEQVSSDHPVAWLTADAGDSVGSLWSAILGSVAATGALDAESALAQIVPGAGFGAPEVDQVADGIAALDHPLTLVIDEMHRVANPAVLETVARLIDRRPEGLRLILIGRSMPRLRLERARLAGDLVEIDAGMLALTRDEVAQFCMRTGSHLADADIDILLDRTQGWPAGIRLALLSAARGDLHKSLRRFGGRDELVAAYLLEEVLEQLPPADRRFLLATSVVSVMTPDLARALSGRDDSRAVLDRLVAKNALTVRWADRPDWYTYHPLLRELLADRLAAENPDIPDVLHRRAAEWAMSQGHWVVAIRHFAAARDWVRAADLLATTAVPLVLSTQAPTLEAALEPAERESEVHPTAETLLAATTGAFLRGDHDAMMRAADDAMRAWAGRPDEPSIATSIVFALVRMVGARVNHLDEVVDRCAEIISMTDSTPREQVPAAAAYALIARNNRAIGRFHQGEIALATSELVTAKASAGRVGMELMATAADCYLALVDLIDGSLSDVAARTTAIGVLAERRGWMRQPQLLALSAATAWMHVERGALDEAERAIAHGRAMAVGLVDGGAAVLVDIAAIRLAVTRADAFAAHTECDRLACTVGQVGTLPALLQVLRCTEVARARILFGDSRSEADDHVAVISDLRDLQATVSDQAGTYQTAAVRLALAWAYHHRGRFGDTLDALGPSNRYAPHRLLAVEAAVLAAVASAGCGRLAAAQDSIGEAVRLAAPIDHLRPFLLAGSPVVPLLTRHEHLDDTDRAFVRELISRLGGEVTAPSPDPVLTVDPLTDREMAVLNYLPTMYKASEIAADLFVSVNTVKTHQQAIYRKLGVSSRRAAVDRARECNLL